MPSGSVVVRKSIGRQLRSLRIAARKTPADVDESGIASTSRLQRIETGKVPARLETVWALCRLYNADDATTSKLAEMAKITTRKGWWEDFTSVIPPGLRTYVELEAAANRVSTYDPELIPGLLQTPAYHRAIFEFDAYPSVADADRQVELRIQRQRAAFDRSPPLHVTAVLSEGALLRQVGGKKVLAEQRAHLLQMNGQPNVDVLVLPWEAGAHAAMVGGFIILGFDSTEEPDVVYLETFLGGRYVEDEPGVEEGVRKYQQSFDQVRDISIPLEEHQK